MSKQAFDTKNNTVVHDKPKIRKCFGGWECGGLMVERGYIDWYVGHTPTEAYDRWKYATEKAHEGLGFPQARNS